jgi:hypothetical protein
MASIDNILAQYICVSSIIREMEEQEPVGPTYEKSDKYMWHLQINQAWSKRRNLKAQITLILDQELEEYFQLAHEGSWDKREACRLLRQKVASQITMSVDELFLYVGRSVMCIPDQYKDTVINHFAVAMEEWASVDIEVLRAAAKNIGTQLN